MFATRYIQFLPLFPVVNVGYSDRAQAGFVAKFDGEVGQPQWSFGFSSCVPSDGCYVRRTGNGISPDGNTLYVYATVEGSPLYAPGVNLTVGSATSYVYRLVGLKVQASSGQVLQAVGFWNEGVDMYVGSTSVSVGANAVMATADGAYVVGAFSGGDMVLGSLPALPSSGLDDIYVRACVYGLAVLLKAARRPTLPACTRLLSLFGPHLTPRTTGLEQVAHFNTSLSPVWATSYGSSEGASQAIALDVQAIPETVSMCVRARRRAHILGASVF